MSTIDPVAAAVSSPGTSGATRKSAAAGAREASDRFLKLLVTQMQNQDPLNPMDNAQVTTQMAQISTVSGIEELNRTVETLNGQFVQMHALQGATLVGRDVTVEGARLIPGDDGGLRGSFALSASADTVDVEVLNAAGKVIDTIRLGAQGAGRVDFEWDPATAEPAATFRVAARAGAAAVAATPLTTDRVEAVSSGPDGLTLELRHLGSIPYGRIKAFN